MKNFIVFAALVLVSISLNSQVADSIIDIRDGHIYNIVQIGQQWWMQENLNIGVKIDDAQSASDNGIIEKYYYNDNDSLGSIYGGLYTWDEMMDYDPSDDGNPGITQGVCPVGWRIPSDEEWKELESYLGMSASDLDMSGWRGTNQGSKLKEVGDLHWSSPNSDATNQTGFTALGGGKRNSYGGFEYFASDAYFWTSSFSGGAWPRNLRSGVGQIIRMEENRDAGYSVRCIRDTYQSGELSLRDDKMDTISYLDFSAENTIDTLVIFNANGGTGINVTSISTENPVFKLNRSSAVLGPGDSIHLIIRFDPEAGGIQYNDTLRILSNSAVNPLIDVPLTGFSNIDSTVDFRDHQTYRIVRINQTWWMQENLNSGTMIDGSLASTDNGIIEKYCYDDVEAMCDTLGGLYRWNEAMDYNLSDDGIPGITRGICPRGWHMPTEAEWTAMVDFLGGTSVAGKKLKEAGTGHWDSPNTGTNESGFTALPGGFYQSDWYGQMGSHGYFWTSTQYSPTNSYNRYFLNGSDFVEFSIFQSKNDGHSVRCIMDSARVIYLSVLDTKEQHVENLEFTDDRRVDTLAILNYSAGKTIYLSSIGTTGSSFNVSTESDILGPGDSIHLKIEFTPPEKGVSCQDTLKILSNDPYLPEISIPLTGSLKPDSIIDIRDDQVYKIVKIGEQWWMQENLNIGIPIVTTDFPSDNGIIEKYSYQDSPGNCDTYGGLYQWDEMMDYQPSDNGNPGTTRGICPAGWHLPTDEEWKELEIYLGMSPADADDTGWRGTNEGGKLKETGIAHWKNPNTDATNEHGFTALPGGSIGISDIGSTGKQYSANFWTSSDLIRRRIHHDQGDIYRNTYSNEWALSVRCMRNTRTFSHLSVLSENLDLISELEFYGSKASHKLVLINSSPGFSIYVSSIHTNNPEFSSSLSSLDLSPGDTVHFNISFDPAVKNIYSDVLTIESDDPYMPVIEIPLNGTYPPEVSFTDSSNISCFGLTDGSATVTPSLGTPPYSYQWNDPDNSTDSIISGLEPDIYYSVTVTDNLGWSVVDSILLSEPDKLMIDDTVHHVLNTGLSEGKIDITVTGGTEPYAYLWSVDSTTEDLTDIPAGEYSLLVTDQNACVDSNTYRVKEPIMLALQQENISCFNANDGSISMEITGGIQPYTILWSNDETLQELKDLSPGKYIVEVTDDFGVKRKDSVLISEPAELLANPDYSDSICSGSENGYIVLNPSGGTIPYSYAWSNDSTSQSISDLTAGQYSVTVSDSNDCFDSVSFVIHPLEPYSDERICVVTIDLFTGQNMIVWEKTPDKGIRSYNIYREDELIGTVRYNDLSIFKDTVADPEARPYLYSISITDTCGNESGHSPYHKPFFLQYVSSVDGVNLRWSRYEIEDGSISFQDYEIWRGSDSIGLSPVAQKIPPAIDVYTDKDPNALLNRYFYRVAGILEFPCNPSGGNKAGTGPYQHALSNMDDNKLKDPVDTAGTFDFYYEDQSLAIYPNPFRESTTIKFPNPESESFTLELTDLSGKVCRMVGDIRTSEYVIKRGNLKSGLYFVELRGPKNFRGKILLEKLHNPSP